MDSVLVSHPQNPRPPVSQPMPRNPPTSLLLAATHACSPTTSPRPNTKSGSPSSAKSSCRLITQLLKPEVYQSDPLRHERDASPRRDAAVERSSCITSCCSAARTELMDLWLKVVTIMDRLMNSGQGDNLVRRFLSSNPPPELLFHFHQTNPPVSSPQALQPNNPPKGRSRLRKPQKHAPRHVQLAATSRPPSESQRSPTETPATRSPVARDVEAHQSLPTESLCRAVPGGGEEAAGAEGDERGAAEGAGRRARERRWRRRLRRRWRRRRRRS